MLFSFVVFGLLLGAGDPQFLSDCECFDAFKRLKVSSTCLTEESLMHWTTFGGQLALEIRARTRDVLSNDSNTSVGEISSSIECRKSVTPPLSSSSQTPPTSLQSSPGNDDSRSDRVGVLTSPCLLQLPEESALAVELSPVHLFESPQRIPKDFLVSVVAKLPYLRNCGVTLKFVQSYFIRNWERVKKNPVLLDVGCDVSLCHVQAVVNYMLFDLYGSAQPKDIPSHVMAYFAFCLLLSDHSEVRDGKRSVGYLHHPEHFKGIKNRPCFPLSGFVMVGTKAKEMDSTAFFARLRMVVAYQTLLFASAGQQFPCVFPHEISGVPIPKTSYPETFRLFFSAMQQNEIPFLVELAHITSLRDGGIQIDSEVVDGFYSQNRDIPESEEEKILVLQMFTANLLEEDKREMLRQLSEFKTIEALINQIVCQTKGQPDVDVVTNESAPVTGWLKAVFSPETARSVALFDDKFCQSYVRGLLQKERKGIAPRHMYCSTRSAFNKELEACRNSGEQ